MNVLHSGSHKCVETREEYTGGVWMGGVWLVGAWMGCVWTVDVGLNYMWMGRRGIAPCRQDLRELVR
ncbi:hypothetical protein Bca4012_051971 [Brassica carinata]